MEKILNGFTFIIVVTALMIFVIVGLMAGLFISNNNREDAMKDTKHDLQLQGYTIVKGQINSPTVIEITDNYQTFIQATKDNTKIYEANTYQYIAIFNATYGLAYQPTYEAPWLWGIWG
jgi:hypothetical protein